MLIVDPEVLGLSSRVLDGAARHAGDAATAASDTGRQVQAAGLEPWLAAAVLRWSAGWGAETTVLSVGVTELARTAETNADQNNLVGGPA